MLKSSLAFLYIAEKSLQIQELLLHLGFQYDIYKYRSSHVKA